MNLNKKMTVQKKRDSEIGRKFIYWWNVPYYRKKEEW